MKKILIGLLLVASLLIVTACTTSGSKGTTGHTSGNTTAPVTENSPLKIKTINWTSDEIGWDDKLYIDVEFEMTFDGQVPQYTFILTDPNGKEITESSTNNENPALQSCKVALQNANHEVKDSLSCNSMFEVNVDKYDGTYVLVVKENDVTIQEIQIQVKDNKVTILK